MTTAQQPARQPGPPTATQWRIDPNHTNVEFTVKHMMFTTVHGRFTEVDGTVHYDEADSARSTLEVSIKAASIDTRSPDRDTHLRSQDFFDVDKYPTITFRSTRIQSTGGKGLRIAGDLTIHGVTRPVTLEATEEGRGKDPWGGDRAGFSATTTIDRHDFGLKWNQALEHGGWLVGQEVKISLDVQLVRQD
jgi:polyisoprenoid-binding protein YceI